MAEKLEPKIVLTDAPDPADTAIVQEGLRAYNTSQAGYDDYRPMAVFVTDPATGHHLQKACRLDDFRRDPGQAYEDRVGVGDALGQPVFRGGIHGGSNLDVSALPQPVEPRRLQRVAKAGYGIELTLGQVTATRAGRCASTPASSDSSCICSMAPRVTQTYPPGPEKALTVCVSSTPNTHGWSARDVREATVCPTSCSNS